jgi:hypothetical protein
MTTALVASKELVSCTNCFAKQLFLGNFCIVLRLLIMNAFSINLNHFSLFFWQEASWSLVLCGRELEETFFLDIEAMCKLLTPWGCLYMQSEIINPKFIAQSPFFHIRERHK